MQLDHIYHLYRRMGFGILPKDAEVLTALSRQEVVDELFEKSERPQSIDIGLKEFDQFFENNPRPSHREFTRLVMKSKERHFEFNERWMERMINSSQGLNERMTLFWANIFVCRDNVITFVQQYNNTLREHALGSFPKLVKAVSREPAMMKFLNTNQNRRTEPNENFARELMELFTLGEGKYKESDIKEAARAFTGYNFHLHGEFRLAIRHHDFGQKEFFGWTGDLDGDDIINIICRQRDCARYICTRIYSYFVSTDINADHIEEMTEVFFNNYEITDVMRHIMLSDWFYDPAVIGVKIKSPLDLLVSIARVVPYQFSDSKRLISVQRLLGQSPLQAPNVAGWEGGRSWINANTLMLRLKLPSIMVGEGVIPATSLSDEFRRNYFGNNLISYKDWEEFHKQYGHLDRDAIAKAICAPNLEAGSRELLSGYDELPDSSYAIQLMSMPEFQLS